MITLKNILKYNLFNFSAHGKSMADGLSGITKRAAYRESLKPNVKILTAQDLYKYCQGFLGSTTLQYLYISKGHIREINRKHHLISKFGLTSTIPGTRSNHSFIPNGKILEIRRYSASTVKMEHDFDKLPAFTDLDKYSEGDYVIFLNSSIRFVGLIRSIDFDEGEVLLGEMQQSKNHNIFSWPTPEKEKTIAMDLILNKIDIPNLIDTRRMYSTRNITYSLSENDFNLLLANNK
jgi:hypothetical protein